MQARIKPNLFIVGAPKCGTTSMADYLSQHPDVFMAGREIHYFGSDLYESEKIRQIRPRPTEEDYLKNFEQAEGHAVVGEKSVSYLHSTSAPQEIDEFSPASRVIIMLRNPVDFMYSMHSQALYSQDETELSFSAALGLEEGRRRGEGVPQRAYVRHATFYRDLARFSDQTERYRAAFPPEQLHIVLLDDLAADPEATWAGVCAFLGIPADGVSQFRAVNANKRLYVPGLARAEALLRRVLVPRLRLDRFPERLKEVAKRALSGLEELNTHHEPRPPLDSTLRSALLTEFEQEIAALEKILDRDLTHWRD